VIRLDELLVPSLRLDDNLDSRSVKRSVRGRPEDNQPTEGSGERSFLKCKVVIEFYHPEC
jgi:hypothetical protein